MRFVKDVFADIMDYSTLEQHKKLEEGSTGPSEIEPVMDKNQLDELFGIIDMINGCPSRCDNRPSKVEPVIDEEQYKELMSVKELIRRK